MFFLRGLLFGVVVVSECDGQNDDGEGFCDKDRCCDHLVSRGLLVRVEAPSSMASVQTAVMARAALWGVPVAYIHVMMPPWIHASVVKKVS